MRIDSQIDFAYLAQAPMMVRLLCCLALLMALQATGYLWYLDGKLLTLEQLRQQEMTLKASIVNQTQKLSLLPALTQHISQLKRLEKQSLQQLVQPHQSSQILQAINQLAKHHHLSLRHIDWGQRHQQASYYLLPLNIELAGSYHDIARFIQQIATLPQLIHISEMAFGRSGVTTQPVNVTLRAQLYQASSEFSSADQLIGTTR